MKIVVTGDGEYVDFLIGILEERKHKVTVISPDMRFCEQLSAVYDVNAVLGDPCQESILEEAGIRDYDVVAALGKMDADNLEICQLCKKALGIKSTVCLVSNPRNVEVFRELGMDQVVNVPAILAGVIG